MYLPGVFSLRQAKVVAIHGSETFAGADFTLTLGSLHTVRGRLAADGDGRAPNAGLVTLKEHGSAAQWRFVELKKDGSFSFSYVPSGTYDLATRASDQGQTSIPGTAQPGMSFHQYRTQRTTITVGDEDLALPVLQVTALKPGEAPETDLP